MKIIYLDIDGVLNKPNEQIFNVNILSEEKIILLKEIVEKTGAKIVLVSSLKEGWIKDTGKKYNQTPEAIYLDGIFEKYGLEIFDKTESGFFGRSKGVLDFCFNNGVEKFVIIDDGEFDYNERGLSAFHVCPNSELGLTKKDAEKSIQILNN